MSAALTMAADLFALTLHNLFKAFFPDRIVLAGYFAHNPWIFRLFPRYREGSASLFPPS